MSIVAPLLGVFLSCAGATVAYLIYLPLWRSPVSRNKRLNTYQNGAI